LESHKPEEFTDTDKELDEIVDAISDNMTTESITPPDVLLDQIGKSEESEVDINEAEIETDISKDGIEKEIVQEMIKDFYGEKEPGASDIDEIEQLETDIEDHSSETQPDIRGDKLKSLEDDLLNIFEDLDKIDLNLPQKGKQFEQLNDDLVTEKDSGLETTTETESATVDSFDDYLKNIDEIVFTEKSIDKTIEIKQTKSNFVQAEQKVEIEEDNTTTREKTEKSVIKPRNIRPKDLFSYLRKKEIKKIVSFIFANDEEDFTNTVERIMDCHSYKEASEILKAVFTSYKISPYSKEAITFTNAVSNYFRQA
jgi:hypothetical protein